MAVVAIHHTRRLSIGCCGYGSGVNRTHRCCRFNHNSYGRGSREALLVVTGRDLDEQEIPLSFDEDTCEWIMMETDAKSMLGPERRAILEVLEKAGRAMTPKEIATSGGLLHGSVKHMIRYLHEDGLVARKEGGRYVLEKAVIS